MKDNLRHAVAVAALLLPAAALAQGADDWQFHAILYGYFPSLSGTTAFPPANGGSSVTVDASKIIENLNSAFMGTLDASKGKWGVTTDLFYANLGAGKSQTHDFSLANDRIPGDVSANVHLDVKNWIWTIAGTYDVVDGPQARMQLLGGARLLDVKQNVDWQLSGNIASIALPDRQGSADTSLTNWDAIVGLRGRLEFGSNHAWFVPYYADVGAGNSDLTYQAIAGLGYSFGWGDVLLAWRYLKYDMKSSEPIQSLSFNGPAIGLGFRW